jgi:heptosyltransferase-2
VKIEQIRRMLVRVPNWIGDAVMCEPALAALHEALPDAQMTVLARPAIAEVLDGHAAVHATVIYDYGGRHAGLSGKWHLARRLRRDRFDLAVLFQNAFEAALITWMAGIPRRWGYATDGRSVLLSHPIQVPTPAEPFHQVRYYLEMVRRLGATTEARVPRLSLKDFEERQVTGRLAAAGVDARDFVLGLNPGSVYGGAKRWFPERFAETADRLVEEVGRDRAWVVIVGAKGEEVLGREIAARMKSRTLVWSGQTTIRELMGVARRCQLFLTNDTGPMHVASAFGVPTVAVFGSTDWRTTAPFGAQHETVRHAVDCAPCLLRECPIDHRCMVGVTVDMVTAAGRQLLSHGKGPERIHVAPLILNAQVSNPSARHASRGTPHVSLKGVTIFLDRDGTLNHEVSYIRNPQELRLIPGAAESVARLNRAGARVVLVTNQSGIGRGFVTPEVLEATHVRLKDLLATAGGRLDAIYFCPHHPDDGCLCRKPGVLMVERATRDLGLDLGRAYVIGDQTRDIELGHRVGIKAVLVRTGPTSADALVCLQEKRTPPHYVADSIVEAVAWVEADGRSGRTSTPPAQTVFDWSQP